MGIPFYSQWLSNASIINFNFIIFINKTLNPYNAVREDNLHQDVNYYFVSPTLDLSNYLHLTLQPTLWFLSMCC